MNPTLARKIFCIAALFCAAAWNAQAVNLVNNPGFETGNFSGWTVNDPSNFSGVGVNPAFAHSGNNYAFLGATPGTGSLSQSLATATGQAYSLSFWLANDITQGLPAGNSFQAFFNGVLVFSLGNQAPFAYTQFTISNLVATGGATGLQFVYNHNNDFWRLDDVNVSAQGVPEAFSTIWLALPAFGALGMLQFSRARARKSLALI